MKRSIILFFFLTYWFFSNFSQAQTTTITHFINDEITLLDSVDNTVIIAPNNKPLWEAFGSHPYPSAEPPVISISGVTNGYDLTYTFVNNTAGIVSLGKINIGGIQFDSIVSFRNFERDGAEIVLNHKNKNYKYEGSYYPFNLYSPVSVISSNNYTIGISIQYPVLEYESALYLQLEATNTNGARSWMLGTSINQFDPKNKYSEKGNLLPGQTKKFIVSVRVIKKSDDCNHWLNTLLPYKHFFDSTYQGVTYTRDPRPIKGYQLCFNSDCNGSPDTNDINPVSEYINPYCFRSFLTDNQLRPDIYGFGPLARHLANYETKGYNRILLWNASGLYLNVAQLRYCYKFASHWMEGNTNLFPFSYGHKMGDAPDSLNKIVASPSRNLGFWWGRASEVMYDWDTAYYEPFNMDNPAHIAAGFKELDLAVAAGGTMIGLDAFKQYIFPWDGYKWIQMMRQRAPQVKFCTEKGGSDITNTVAAFFFKSDEIKEPHYLSDFLLPGNEKWLQTVSDGSLATEAKRVAALGYVPVIMSEVAIDSLELFTAVKGWETFIPFPQLGNKLTMCPGDSVQLNGTHAGAINYLWSTGETSAQINVQQPGTYWVKTLLRTGCIQTDSIIVEDVISPSANFSYTVTGLTVNVTNHSSGTNNCFWNYSDGNTNTTYNPSPHSYTSTGNYTVTLIANNECKSDTMTKVVSIVSSGVNEGELLNTVTIFPNPVVNNELTIRIVSPDFSGCDLSITNTLGELLFSATISENTDSDFVYKFQDDVSGIYFVTIRAGNTQIAKKIIRL